MSDSPTLLAALQNLPASAVLEGLARLHQAVFVADADGRVIWMSEELERLRGEDDLDGSTGWKAGLPGHDYFADVAQLDEIRRRFARDGQVHGAPAELLGCDGLRVPVEVDGVRIPSIDAGVPLFVGIVRPLSERATRDRELRETAEFLSAILESSPVPVLAVDPRGFVQYANPAIEGLLGHTAATLIDKPVAMLAGSTGELASAILGDLPDDHEIEFCHTDGTPRFVTVAASALRIADGSAKGSVILLHDQTARRNVAEDLRRKNSELEHYVQNVTHDLRSPLVSLLGFSRLLHQEYAEGMDDTARHFLDRIENAGHAMEALINDLLELSRIGGTHDHKAHVNLSDVLNQLHAEMKPRLEAQAVQLCLPEDPIVVLCDRTRLYQVFSNLVGNALDYMGPVDGATITIDVHEDPDEHRIVVRDNGRGIEPSQRERIFELFQTVGPRADGRRGTGIGLAIVKKIAQSQRGRVWVESRPGEGAAFHLTLPRS
ncbi:MAG: PAS domain S-box protein [Deltaproteobacteria bacterium]|nr:PAS domain S-box protein [Deltaproteobacteria bacterium]MBW2444307.1 PAS domain S-box protein [Deltaproteobacteria bacterium]